MVTAGVAYPFDTCWNMPYMTTVPGDWVLKTFPAYQPQQALPVYPIRHTDRLDTVLASLPRKVTHVMVGDGINYKVIAIRAQALR